MRYNSPPGVHLKIAQIDESEGLKTTHPEGRVHLPNDLVNNRILFLSGSSLITESRLWHDILKGIGRQDRPSAKHSQILSQLVAAF